MISDSLTTNTVNSRDGGTEIGRKGGREGQVGKDVVREEGRDGGREKKGGRKERREGGRHLCVITHSHNHNNISDSSLDCRLHRFLSNS